jgi:hypothetical protein
MACGAGFFHVAYGYQNFLMDGGQIVPIANRRGVDGAGSKKEAKHKSQ